MGLVEKEKEEEEKKESGMDRVMCVKESEGTGKEEVPDTTGVDGGEERWERKGKMKDERKRQRRLI